MAIINQYTIILPVDFWTNTIVNSEQFSAFHNIKRSSLAHLPVDLLGMFKNGNDVPNYSNAEVHHDVFTEVH